MQYQEHICSTMVMVVTEHGSGTNKYSDKYIVIVQCYTSHIHKVMETSRWWLWNCGEDGCGTVVERSVVQ